MLLEAEVGRDNDSKYSDVLLWCNNIHCKLQRVKGEVLQRASCTSPEHLGLVHVQLQSMAGHPLVNVPDTVFQSDDSRCCVVGERQWSSVDSGLWFVLIVSVGVGCKNPCGQKAY